MDSRFRAVVERARKSDDLYFAALLSKDQITESLREAGVWFQGWVYTVAVTTRVFSCCVGSIDHRISAQRR